VSTFTANALAALNHCRTLTYQRGAVIYVPGVLIYVSGVQSYLEEGIQTPMAQGRSTKIIKWIRTSRLSR